MSSHTPANAPQKITLPHIPELYDPNFLNVLLPPSPNGATKSNKASKPTNPMIDALKDNANHARTWNNAQTLASTSSAVLDAFNQLGPWSYSPELESLLFKAWDEDADATLRIIWNLRSIHDGKSDREAFYRAFGWLYDNHPRTAIANLDHLVRDVCKKPPKPLKEGEEPRDEEFRSHGYWKDLLNILALANLHQLSALHEPATFLHAPRAERTHRRRGEEKVKGPKQDNEQVKADAQKARAVKANESYDLLLKNLANVPKFRALYVCVARLFADRLVEDLKLEQSLEGVPEGPDRLTILKKISLAAKWAPTPLQTHDRVTNISTAISLLLNHSRDVLTTPTYRFPSSITTQPNSESTQEMLTLRSFFQRHVLTPLRKTTAIVEPLMSSGQWSEIRYTRIPSVCMKNNTESFFKHDKERFKKFLLAVEEKKVTISGATLLPHELVKQAMQLSSFENEEKASLKEVKKELAETQMRVVEAQWDTLLTNLRNSGSLDNCLALCDVSGSMGSIGCACAPTKGKPRRGPERVQPILPAVALSLVLCQLARPPFDNTFITFSSTPKFVQLEPRIGLANTVKKMIGTAWGMNTDFRAVFLNLLLPLALKHNLKQQDMIKRIFVFSDMQFDEAASENHYDAKNKEAVAAKWETTHDAIGRAYKEAGYEVPQVVYWNLAGGGTAEVESNREGVAMMSGFSPNMLKVFMGEDADMEEKEDSTLVAEQWEDLGVEEGKEVGEGEEGKEAGEGEVGKKEDFTPMKMMQNAIGNESYAGLRVLD